LATALLPSPPPPNTYVMELGTGCGIVGIAIAQVLAGTNVLLTDLPEAQEIVDRNMKQSELTNDSKLRFEELDWSADLPLQLQLHVDLILAADCTYNADSRYGYLNSNHPVVVIDATLVRH
jgi:methylase of polypeptide subunit release factors